VHTIFVSSDLFMGDFGGVAGGDQQCANLAQAAALPGTFLAVMSETGLPASSRINVVMPVQDMDGNVVASDSDDLWDAMLDHSVQTTEKGDPYLGYVWTGTLASGAAATRDCDGWTMADNNTRGERGRSDDTDGSWVAIGWEWCSYLSAIYCIEQ
jgi:hypothetical protein